MLPGKLPKLERVMDILHSLATMAVVAASTLRLARTDEKATTGISLHLASEIVSILDF